MSILMASSSNIPKYANIPSKVFEAEPNLAHELAYLKAQPTFTDEEKKLLEELRNAESEEEHQAVLKKLITIGNQNALLIIEDDKIERTINYEEKAKEFEEEMQADALSDIHKLLRVLTLEDLAKVEEMVAQAKAAGGFTYADDDS